MVGDRRRGLARGGAGGAASCPGELQRFIDRALRGEIELRLRNLDENARLLYYSGQQILWGLLTASSAALGTVWSGRGLPRAAWAAGIGAGFFGLMLILAWFAGRPRRLAPPTLTPAVAGSFAPALIGYRSSPSTNRAPHAPHPREHPGEAPVRRAARWPRRRCSCAICCRRRKDPLDPVELDAALPPRRAPSPARAQDRSPGFPTGRLFSQPWSPVPIYAYGVMLGTSLFVGWFLAMRLAKQDDIDQQAGGTIYMWAAIWSIIGSRLLWVFTTPGVSLRPSSR